MPPWSPTTRISRAASCDLAHLRDAGSLQPPASQHPPAPVGGDPQHSASDDAISPCAPPPDGPLLPPATSQRQAAVHAPAPPRGRSPMSPAAAVRHWHEREVGPNSLLIPRRSHGCPASHRYSSSLPAMVRSGSQLAALPHDGEVQPVPLRATLSPCTFRPAVTPLLLYFTSSWCVHAMFAKMP
ncbi:hypothetical protein VPH35_097263 [Triticum aestivum]